MILVLFIPISIVTYLDKDWNIVIIFLIASIAILIFINIEDFELFKISKEGIEVKRILREAKLTLDEANRLAINTLKQTLRQVMKLGNFNGLEAVTEYNFYNKFYTELKESDSELNEMLQRLKNTTYRLIALDLLIVSDGLLKNETNSKKLTEQQRRELNEICNSLNPEKFKIGEIKYQTELKDRHLNFEFINKLVLKMLSTVNEGDSYKYDELEADMNVYLYFFNVSKELGVKKQKLKKSKDDIVIEKASKVDTIQ